MPMIVCPSEAMNSFGAYWASVPTTSVPLDLIAAGTFAAIAATLLSGRRRSSWGCSKSSTWSSCCSRTPRSRGPPAPARRCGRGQTDHRNGTSSRKLSRAGPWPRPRKYRSAGATFDAPVGPRGRGRRGVHPPLRDVGLSADEGLVTNFARSLARVAGLHSRRARSVLALSIAAGACLLSAASAQAVVTEVSGTSVGLEPRMGTTLEKQRRRHLRQHNGNAVLHGTNVYAVYWDPQTASPNTTNG